MSTICMCCTEEIGSPNDAWCGFTLFSPGVNNVCEDCLKKIPDEHRMKFEEPPMFQILFAKLKPENERSEIEPGYMSKAEQPEFWVDANIIACNLMRGTLFLKELYPYYCIAELPKLIHPLIKISTPENQYLSFKLLCEFGAPLEALLFNRRPSELERPLFSKFPDDFADITDEEFESSKELLGFMLVKFAHVFYEGEEQDWLKNISSNACARANFAVELAQSFLNTHIYMYTSKHCSDCRKNRFRASALSNKLRDIIEQKCKITDIEKMSAKIDKAGRQEAEEYRIRNRLE